MRCKYKKDKLINIQPYGDVKTSCMSAMFYSGVFNMPQLHKLGWTKAGEVLYISFPNGLDQSTQYTLCDAKNLDSNLPRCLVWKLNSTMNLYYSYVEGRIFIHSYYGLNSKSWLPTINIKNFEKNYTDNISGLTFNIIEKKTDKDVTVEVKYNPEDKTPEPELEIQVVNPNGKDFYLVNCKLLVHGLYPLGDKKFVVKINNNIYHSKKIPLITDKTINQSVKISKKYKGNKAIVSLGWLSQEIQLN